MSPVKTAGVIRSCGAGGQEFMALFPASPQPHLFALENQTSPQSCSDHPRRCGELLMRGSGSILLCSRHSCLCQAAAGWMIANIIEYLLVPHMAPGSPQLPCGLAFPPSWKVSCSIVIECELGILQQRSSDFSCSSCGVLGVLPVQSLLVHSGEAMCAWGVWLGSGEEEQN